VRFLLDTHTLLWWFAADPALSRRAVRVIEDAANELFVSAASAWEMAIKNRAGRLHAQFLLDRFEHQLTEKGIFALPISLDHAVRAGALPEHYRDPFDRMLVAQAQAEDLAILSNDASFDHYGVRRVW
jgi:PIN domain nuclease of toxin-antitoxin system